MLCVENLVKVEFMFLHIEYGIMLEEAPRWTRQFCAFSLKIPDVNNIGGFKHFKFLPVSATLFASFCMIFHVVLLIVLPIFEGCISSSFKAFNNNLCYYEILQMSSIEIFSLIFLRSLTIIVLHRI
jgi:hypothetical protein